MYIYFKYQHVTRAYAQNFLFSFFLNIIIIIIIIYFKINLKNIINYYNYI